MDAARFEIILRSLATSRSRRSMLRLLAGSAVGGLLTLRAVPTQAKKKPKVTLCHSGQTMRVSTKAKQKHLRHGDTLGACPLPPPGPVLTYQCPGPSDDFYAGVDGTHRWAQTFIPAQSGPLHQIQFEVVKDTGTTGDFLVELLAVGGDRRPTNTVLAAATVPNASVPDGPTTVTATFAGPSLVAGTEYAAAISRPTGTQLKLGLRFGNPCTGEAFDQPPGAPSFINTDAAPDSLELVTSITVLA